MNLKSLSTEQMVGISATLLDPKQDRPLLLSFETVAPQVKKLDRAHASLLGTQSHGVSVSAALKAIQTEEAAVDKRHDRKLRGLSNVLSGFADLADEPALRDSYLALANHLAPDGLGVIRMSYTAEAGAAALAEGRMTADDKQLLHAGALPHGLGTLANHFDHYVEAGKRLGALEGQRAQHVQDKDGPTRSDSAKARLAWITTMHALITNLNSEDDVSDAQRQRLLGPLQKALDAAVAGPAAAAAAPAAVTPAPTPAPKA
jgi:hypothetical protein